MSAILQESGFKPEDIRVVFDDRATAEGIRERLRWLLSGVQDGDARFFFYSGHGAQLPTYGTDGKINQVQSCLVPYDFKWTLETAITDEDMVQLYSQLPYDARFMMVLDCCHSGGMTRGSQRIRGLEPPDDIRHRMLQWNKDEKMWVRRPLGQLNETLSDKDSLRFQGEMGDTAKLGRAMSMRTLSNKDYDKVRKTLKHKGPFVPIVYEACGENEYSYEYLNGATSYGAFTYALDKVLRDIKEPVSFEALLKATRDKLHRLDYQQTAQIFGPTAILKEPVPFG